MSAGKVIIFGIAGAAVGAILLGLVMRATNPQVNASPARQPEVRHEKPVPLTPVAPVVASAELQAKRLTLIEEMKSRGIIHKMDRPGTIPRVHVLPAFYALNFDEKQSFLSVIAGYSYALSTEQSLGDTDFMRVMDAMTGKEIGRVTSRGLKLY